MASVDQRVRAFLSDVGGGAQDDADVTNYIVGFVEDCTCVEDLVECIQAFVEPFEALPEARKLALASQLLAEPAGAATPAKATPVTAHATRVPAPVEAPRDLSAPAPEAAVSPALSSTAASPAIAEASVSGRRAGRRKRGAGRRGSRQAGGAGAGAGGSVTVTAVRAPPRMTLGEAVVHFLESFTTRADGEAMRGDVEAFASARPSVSDLAGFVEALSPAFARLPGKRRTALVEELLVNSPAPAEHASRLSVEQPVAAEAAGGGGGGGGRHSDRAGSAAGGKRQPRAGNRGGRRNQAAAPASQFRYHGPPARDPRAPLVRQVGGILGRASKHGGDEAIAEYMAGFLEDADNLGDVEALHDMLSSMLPGFTDLPAGDQRRVGRDLVTVARDHAAYRAQEAERARTRRNRARAASRKPLVPPTARASSPAPAPAPVPVAAAVTAPSVASDDPRVALLHELQPGFPQQLLPGVVQRFNGDMESAAAFLLQAGAVVKQEAFVEGLRQRELQRLKEQEEDAKRAEEVRRAVMKRYDEEVDTKDKTYRPKPRFDGRDRKAMKNEKRFYQGKMVYMKHGKQFVAE